MRKQPFQINVFPSLCFISDLVQFSIIRYECSADPSRLAAALLLIDCLFIMYKQKKSVFPHFNIWVKFSENYILTEKIIKTQHISPDVDVKDWSMDYFN